MRRLLLFACLIVSACTSALPAPTVTVAPPSATARITLRIVDLAPGLVMDVPVGWGLNGPGYVNRITWRYVTAGNGDVATLSTIPGNGDIDAAALPSGRVTIEVESLCGLSCQGPADETSLPLDWSAATQRRTGLPAGRHEQQLGVRWFDQPFVIVARWTDDAPAADIEAIADVVRSVRPDPAPPAAGEFNGWAGLGPLAAIPVGTVRFQPLPDGAIMRQPYRLWDNVPYFLVRGKQHLLAFTSRPLQDQRCDIHYDGASDQFACSVDGRTYQWTRFGRYLGTEPQSDLPQHRVIVRDGMVWVRYVEDSLLVPSVPDEAAER